MYFLTFFKGFGVGFTIAAIIGPISIMCIRSTLQYGQKVGLAMGLGASLADAVYGLIAGLGLTLISDFLLGYQFTLRLVGGLFLIYLGITTFLEKPEDKISTVHPRGFFNIVMSLFFLTLSNPVTIISFTAIFAGLGLGQDITYTNALLLVLGIFIGAMIWWIILTSFLRIFHARVNATTMNIINKCSGALITAFGIASIASLLIG